jgi:hypothetical protein
MPILEPGKPYTFGDIFKLKSDLALLLPEFDVQLQRQFLTLNQFQGDLERLPQLQQRLEQGLRRIDLSSETARREALIAPILIDVAQYADAQIRIEYPLKVSQHLQGNLDYFVRSQAEVLVVEAKQEDLTNGLAQLAVELIAIDHWEYSPDRMQQPQLLGAVSTGTVWQFAILHRQARLFEQDLNLYAVPKELEAVQRILIAALS